MGMPGRPLTSPNLLLHSSLEKTPREIASHPLLDLRKVTSLRLRMAPFETRDWEYSIAFWSLGWDARTRAASLAWADAMEKRVKRAGKVMRRIMIVFLALKSSFAELTRIVLLSSILDSFGEGQDPIPASKALKRV